MFLIYKYVEEIYTMNLFLFVYLVGRFLAFLGYHFVFVAW